MGPTFTKLLEQDIFTLLDLQHLPEEEKEELYTRAYDTIIHRILLRVADQLEDSDINQLKSLFEKQDSSAIDRFFSEHDIDIDQIAATETFAYKAELAALNQTLKDADSQKWQ